MGKLSRKTKIKILGARPVLAMSAILGFGCVAGLGYVWQIKQIHSLGREIKAAELRLEDLRRRKDGLLRGYAAMCSPRELEERIKFMKLGLEAPSPDSIVRLSDPPIAPQPQDQAATSLAGTLWRPNP